MDPETAKGIAEMAKQMGMQAPPVIDRIQRHSHDGEFYCPGPTPDPRGEWCAAKDVAPLEEDRARIAWIEEAVQVGILTSCFDLDGGIHVTYERPGEEMLAERNRGTFREAVLALMQRCPNP